MESMRKIFNTSRKHIKKRLLAMVLCCIMILSGVSINISDNVAEAATLNIPNTQFITKDEILKLCTETNGGNGLLATGTNTDVELKVNFGNRPEDVKYNSVNEQGVFSSNVRAGSISWFMAGNEGTGKILLYAEYPIISAQNLDSNSKSYFSQRVLKKPYTYIFSHKQFLTPSHGIYSQDVAVPEKVFANHWGISNLREVAHNLYYENKDYFKDKEKLLMTKSNIVTLDLYNNEYYITEEFLYPATNKNKAQVILVGEKDSINICMKYCKGIQWLRDPSDYKEGGAFLGQYGVGVLGTKSNIYGVDHKILSFAPAFALDISHLRFASVGDGTATAKLEKITDDMAMNLRLGEGSSGYPFTAQHKIKAKASEITYSAPKDSYLMFLAKDADGQLYQYAKKIDANVTNATMSLTNIPGLDKGEDFSTKVWIEKRAGGTLSYATEPIDVYNVKSWGAVKDERVDHVIQYVDKEGKTSVEIKPDNLKDDTIWLKEESEGKASWCGIEIPEGEIDLHKGLRFCIKMLSPTEKEYEDIYNQLDEEQKRKIKENNGIIFKISVEDTDGNKVQLDKPIKLFIQMEEKWDPESLEAYSITQGKSERISIDTSDLEDPERKDSFAIMPLNYFAPVVVYPNKLIEEPVPESTKPPINDNKIDNTTGNKEDNSNNNSKENNTVNKVLSPNTGESSTLGRIIAYLKLMMSSLGIMIIITKTRKKSQDL